MRNLEWFGRLGWHGSKLVLRVFVILLPLLAGAFWSVFRIVLAVFDEEPANGQSQWERLAGYSVEEQIQKKVSITGIPWPENAEHYAWKGHYGDHVNEKWR